MSRTDLTVKRWRRFGHDRLYVTDPDGQQVGWADLSTDLLHPASPDDLAALSEAVSEWKLRPGSEVSPTPPLEPTAPPVPSEPARPVPPSPESPPEDESSWPDSSQPAHLPDLDMQPPVAEPSWTDLAGNRPGAEARAQAHALRDAAPVRTFLSRMVNLRTPERAWRIGADGEEKVASQLAKLVQHDPRWHVLHAIRVGTAGADIDHLVIGPGGVFTLNAKHHPRAAVWIGGDTFLVNGQRQPYVRNSRHEAKRAARLLRAASGIGLDVRGVVVPVNAGSLTIKAAPTDVAVVPTKQLTPWLRSRSQVLGEEAVRAITDAARRSTTWQSQ
jgi:hypothetical protein